MSTLVCWNMFRKASWDFLVAEHIDADLAMLQEAYTPTPIAKRSLDVGPGPWRTPGSNSARAIVGISSDVEVVRIPEDEVIQAGVPGEAVDRHIFAAAAIERVDGDPFYAVSIEAWPDIVHAVPEVLRAVTRAGGRELPFVVGGDFNVRRGYDSTAIFRDLAAAGVPLVGPFGTDGGTTPTKYDNRRGGVPADARRQLDYVFASTSIAETITVRALNGPTKEEWGPSDHCRILIELP